MKCIVLSRMLVKNECRISRITEPHAVISVYTPGGTPANVVRNEHCRGVLPVCFDDIEKMAFRDKSKIADAERTMRRSLIFFDETIASTILDFVRENRETGVETFVVHCNHGENRSPAIAAALLKIAGESKQTDEFRESLRFSPNKEVYDTLLRVASTPS
ncbi:MAG: hypothetical protein WCY56_04035 [Aminobacteriaceae bacterium]